MTLEELKRQQVLAQMMAARQGQSMTPQQGGQMSPNMINQSALLPERPQVTGGDRSAAMQDFTGKEAALAAQMRGGREQMMAPGAQGKQAGNVYVGPTWSEGLSSGISKGMGVYDMAKARQGQKGLEKSRAEKVAGLGKLAEEERYNEQMAVDAATQRNRGIDERDERKLEATLEKNKVAKEQGAEGLERDWAATEVPTYYDPSGKNPPVSGIQTRDGVINPVTRKSIPANYVSQDAYDAMTTDTTSGTASYNEPKRFIDPYSGDEKMVTFNKKANSYHDPVNQKGYTPEDLAGYIPEKEMTEAQREKAVESFIKNNGDTLKLMHDIEAAEETWRESGLKAGENPFNWFTKQTGTLGDITRGLADLDEGGSPSANNYAAAQTTLNTISRLRAGLSQTVNEVERIQEETGFNALANPEVFMKYWPRLKTKVENDIAMANKAASPRTIQAYQRWERNKGEGDYIGGKGTFDKPSGSGRGQGANTQSRKDPNKMSLEELEEELNR